MATMSKRPRNEALLRVATVQTQDVLTTANSYFGLLRQASCGHGNRARLANVCRRRGHVVAGDLTKTFRRPA